MFIDLEFIKYIYKLLQPYCISIYLGGSCVDKYIENHHDIDIVCFAKEPVNKCHIRRILYMYLNNDKLLKDEYDFFQIRTSLNEEHTYGSYINKMMIKLIGEDIQFNFDVIDKDRQEYINILKETVKKLEVCKIKNQKRWYQLARGLFILQNNSYDLTNEQVKIINEIHDQVDGWEKYREELKWQIYQIS